MWMDKLILKEAQKASAKNTTVQKLAFLKASSTSKKKVCTSVAIYDSLWFTFILSVDEFHVFNFWTQLPWLKLLE